MRKLLLGLACALAVSCPSIASAGISVGNVAALPSPDGFNLTIDSATGLEWLDPTVTTNISYNSMISLLGTTPYTGFRHATRAEVGDFFGDLGLPIDNFPGTTSVVDGGASYLAAAAYFGKTLIAGGVIIITQGVTADSVTPGNHLLGDARLIGQSSFTIGSIVSLDDSALPGVGHWLVRESPANAPVPEPMSAVVWAVLGIITAGGYRLYRCGIPTACCDRRSPIDTPSRLVTQLSV